MSSLIFPYHRSNQRSHWHFHHGHDRGRFQDVVLGVVASSVATAPTDCLHHLLSQAPGQMPKMAQQARRSVGRLCNRSLAMVPGSWVPSRGQVSFTPRPVAERQVELRVKVKLIARTVMSCYYETRSDCSMISFSQTLILHGTRILALCSHLARVQLRE